MNKHKQDKINTLIKLEGYKSEEDFVLNNMISSIVPGICNNPGCDATYEYEPDQDMGWCENCDTKTVKSGLVLMGY